MRFDLLDAMQVLEKNFGEDGELLIYRQKDYLVVRIHTFFDDDLLSAQFEISDTCISDANVNVLNLSFSRAISQLNNEINKRRGGHECKDNLGEPR